MHTEKPILAINSNISTEKQYFSTINYMCNLLSVFAVARLGFSLAFLSQMSWVDRNVYVCVRKLPEVLILGPICKTFTGNFVFHISCYNDKQVW